MIVFGAGGFAKEILQILQDNSFRKKITFYDDLNKHNGKLYGDFEILSNVIDVENYFKKIDNDFIIGIGNPMIRERIYRKFSKLGGNFKTVVSSKSYLGNNDINIKEGVVILAGVCISNSVTIGRGTIVYYNSIITHDCIIGDFVEISPSVNILGRVKIGSFSKLGANCTILPDVIIGDGVTIGAGSVVTKNIPSNKKVVGVPGKIIN